jgi:hypothetical protein
MRRRSPNSTLDWLEALSIRQRRAVGGRRNRHSHTSEDEDETDRLISVSCASAEHDLISLACIPLAADSEGQAE